VVGEAGVGKSRLCLEFVQRCRARGVAVYEVHCPAHAATVPWFAMRDLLRSFLGLAQGDEVDAIRRGIAEQLRAPHPGPVEALAASGSLVGEHGAYRLTAPIEALALPVTVQALLASRIDRLGERAKHLLEAAAVIGKQFDEPLLREVSGVVDDRDLDAALSMLQEQDFLRLV